MHLRLTGVTVGFLELLWHILEVPGLHSRSGCLNEMSGCSVILLLYSRFFSVYHISRMPSSKRQRSQSLSEEGPSSAEAEKTQPNKFLRTEPASDADVEGEVIHCTLPPTCNPPNKPTALFGVEELEAHYSKYHAFVCNAEGCHAVFDREHYLNLVCPAAQITVNGLPLD